MSKKHDIAMVNVQKNVALPWPNIYLYIYINTLYIKIYIITIMQINYYLKKTVFHGTVTVHIQKAWN